MTDYQAALEALAGRADAFGECDHCHDDAQLWADPSLEGIELGWQFCRPCWNRYYLPALLRESQGGGP